MGRQIVYCQVCGERILEQDLDAGKAVSAAGHNYCSKCRDQAPAEVLRAAAPATPKRAPAPPSTRIERPLPAHHHAPAPAKSNNGIIIGAVVGVVVLILLVAVFAMSGGGAPTKPTPDKGGSTANPGPKTATNEASVTQTDPAKAARDTFDKLRAYSIEKQNDPGAVVARIQEDLPKLTGSAFYVEAEMLLREHQRAIDQRKVQKIVDELIEKIALTEKSDPDFNSRTKVERWIAETRPLCTDGVQGSRLDEAERAYRNRFEAAATARAGEILDRAAKLQREKKYDDALRELDSYPMSFDGTQGRRDIDRMREEVRLAKQGAELEDNPASQFNQAVNTINSNPNSQDIWDEASKTFVQLTKNLRDAEKLRKLQVHPTEARNILAGCHYLLSWHYCRWRNDLDATFKNLEESFKLGFNNWDDLEGQGASVFLANAKKDARYKPLVERYKNRKLLGVTGRALDAEDAKEAKLAAGQGGLDVQTVNDDSAAGKAGVRKGDWIVGLNGKKLGITDPFADLRAALDGVAANKDYDLDVIRDGKATRLKIRWDK